MKQGAEHCHCHFASFCVCQVDDSIVQVKLVIGEDGELSIGDFESPTVPTAPPRTKEDIARLSSLFHTKDRNFTRIRANRVGVALAYSA